MGTKMTIAGGDGNDTFCGKEEEGLIRVTALRAFRKKYYDAQKQMEKVRQALTPGKIKSHTGKTP